MRMLPDNPSLDHLRQQAKDLLSGLRDADPVVTLTRAQSALAQQYGFPLWADLKAEVERLQGNAAIAEAEVARSVAGRFGLGEVSGDMRSVAPADHLGRLWSLTTQRGRWAARDLGDYWQPIVDPEVEVRLQEAAFAAGILVPRPVRSTSGNIVESIDGRRWRLFEWRHSGAPLAAPAGAPVMRAIGEILATVHILDLPVDRISPWHAYRLRDIAWEEMAARARRQGASWAEALTAAIPEIVALEAIGEGVPDPVPRLCHNALGPGFVRRGGNGRLVVTGWEHAGGQSPGWELCGALMSWAAGPAGARALFEGYAEKAGHLPPLDPSMFRGAVTALVNYLTGQLSLALDAPGDRFLERNAQHLLTNLPKRSRLEQLL